MGYLQYQLVQDFFQQQYVIHAHNEMLGPLKGSDSTDPANAQADFSIQLGFSSANHPAFLKGHSKFQPAATKKVE